MLYSSSLDVDEASRFGGLTSKIEALEGYTQKLELRVGRKKEILPTRGSILNLLTSL